MSAFDQAWQKTGQRLQTTLQTELQTRLKQHVAPQWFKPLRHALQGDAQAALGAVQEGIFSLAQQQLAASLQRLPLLGGMSLHQARQLQREAANTLYARKNLFSILLEDPNPPPDCADAAYLFSFFALEVSFGPNTISGEAKPSGTAVLDHISGSERTDIKITTYDDAGGSIKRWFDGKCGQIAHADGTVGLPCEYLIKLRIMQGAIDEAAAFLSGAISSQYVVRPVSCELEYARSEDQLQQVQLSFVQFDTFLHDLPAP